MVLNKIVPTMYRKDIFDINYQNLKEKGIKCLLFDLDNTIAEISQHKASLKVEQLLNDLKKDFKIIVISNNFKKRISNICSIINVEFVSFSMKPLSRGFKRIAKKYNYDKKEMCIIGDQLISDILGGNRYKIMTILVDPLSKVDFKITKFNRFLETLILKRLKSKGVLERGIYYE